MTRFVFILLVMSRTSMSAPHIIGVVALERPPRLVSGCHKLGYPGDGGRPILDELHDDVV
jgi:hypothetical protein